MPFDPDAYLPYLAELDLPEEKKRDLLQALAIIAQGFVDREFGKLPGQLVVSEKAGTDRQKPLTMMYLQSNPKTERSTP